METKGLSPISIGIIDDQIDTLVALKHWSKKLKALSRHSAHNLIALEFYQAMSGVAVRMDEIHHDIWLVDVALGPGKEWKGTELFVDLLQLASDSRVILYSVQQDAHNAYSAFRRKDAPFRFINKTPDENDLKNLIIEEMPQLRRRWKNRGLLHLQNNWDDLNQLVSIGTDRTMTLAQLCVDILLQMGEDEPISAIEAALANDHLLMCYYRALSVDPGTATKPWNKDLTNQYYSLTKALGHGMLYDNHVENIYSRETIDRMMLDDISRYTLRDATRRRCVRYLQDLDEQPPEQEFLDLEKENWTWTWPGWEKFRGETSLNLLSFLHDLVVDSSMQLRETEGNILRKPMPREFDQWRSFSGNNGICRNYFCEPKDIMTGLSALIRQRRVDQSITIELLSAELPGVTDARILTLRIEISGMRIENGGALHVSEFDTAHGGGFGTVWQSLRGYGQCYVHSASWPGWWNPFSSAWWPAKFITELPPLAALDENATHFIFKIVAPYTSNNNW